MKFFILVQYGPHLWVLCTSFQRKVHMLDDRSLLFEESTSHILLSKGHESFRLNVASQIRFNFDNVMFLCDVG